MSDSPDSRPHEVTEPGLGVPGTPPRIGRYRITDTLGEGGMGVVYAAVRRAVGAAPRLKVLRRESAADPVARERFWREARLAASVNHPHICQLYEIGESDGQLFMAMERLDGEPLAARLGRGAVPLADAVRIGLECSAHSTHFIAAAFVHRDLKPSNIFLTRSRREGARLRRVAGPGRRGHATKLDRARSDAGDSEGTWHPNRFWGMPVTASTDLFAVGAILYEMLSGVAAFGADSIHTVLEKVLHRRGADARRDLQRSPRPIASSTAHSPSRPWIDMRARRRWPRTCAWYGARAEGDGGSRRGTPSHPPHGAAVPAAAA